MVSRYTLDNYTLYRGSKEATINTPTNTTTNLAADVYYYLPIRTDSKIRIRMVPKYYNSYVQGKTDWGDRGFNGNEVMMLDISGPMWNFDMLQFCCKHCDTVGASDPYTHDTITTDARLESGVTFPILARLENSGADDHKLFTGCIVRNWNITWEEGGLVMLNMSIELGREWVGTALSAWPAKPAKNLMGTGEINSRAAMFKKGGAAYDGWVKKFKLSWNDNASLETYSGIYPSDFNYGQRDIQLEFDFVSKVVTDWDDAKDRTNFHLHNRDIDFNIELVRVAANDEWKFALEKLCWIKPPSMDFSDKDYYETRHYIMGLDPDETGNKITITGKDAHDNTRYEGS